MHNRGDNLRLLREAPLAACRGAFLLVVLLCPAIDGISAARASCGRTLVR